jgi:anti-sigma-K factor RskA
MSAELHEELAALYAFDLLEGVQLAQFEALLAHDPALQRLTADFRNTAAALAVALPSIPAPRHLKTRILASIGTSRSPSGKVIFAKHLFTRGFMPWAIAAGFALFAAWTGQRYASRGSETALLRARQTTAEIEIKAIGQQIAAERIIAQRQWQDAQQTLAQTQKQLGDAGQLISERDRQISERDRQVLYLSQRIDALAGASGDANRKLTEADTRIAALSEALTNQASLATLKITALASLLKNSPEALAVAVWDPARQEGILKVEKLPALLAGQDYQLWVVDPQYPNPVDGGVFTVDPQSGATRVAFKAKQTVKGINAFAVTLERKGGVPKAEGPFVLLGK